MSKASVIALTLAARAATITVANGFENDIGASVFRGKLSIVPADMPCCVIVEGEDTNIGEAAAGMLRVSLRQNFIVEGHRALVENDDPTLNEVLNPNDVCHSIVADLKKAFFGGDRTFGNLIGPRKIHYIGRNFGVREDGQALISAGIEFSIEYNEDLANP